MHEVGAVAGNPHRTHPHRHTAPHGRSDHLISPGLVEIEGDDVASQPRRAVRRVVREPVQVNTNQHAGVVGGELRRGEHVGVVPQPGREALHHRVAVAEHVVERPVVVRVALPHADLPAVDAVAGVATAEGRQAGAGAGQRHGDARRVGGPGDVVGGGGGPVHVVGPHDRQQARVGVDHGRVDAAGGVHGEQVHVRQVGVHDRLQGSRVVRERVGQLRGDRGGVQEAEGGALVHRGGGLVGLHERQQVRRAHGGQVRGQGEVALEGGDVVLGEVGVREAAPELAGDHQLALERVHLLQHAAGLGHGRAGAGAVAAEHDQGAVGGQQQAAVGDPARFIRRAIYAELQYVAAREGLRGDHHGQAVVTARGSEAYDAFAVLVEPVLELNPSHMAHPLGDLVGVRTHVHHEGVLAALRDAHLGGVRRVHLVRGVGDVGVQRPWQHRGIVLQRYQQGVHGGRLIDNKLGATRADELRHVFELTVNIDQDEIGLIGAQRECGGHRLGFGVSVEHGDQHITLL